MSKKNDKIIDTYRKKVEAKREALGTKPRANYITNALFPSGHEKINLNTLRSVDDCLHIGRQLALDFNAQAQAAAWLGLPEEIEPVIAGYPLKDWVHDLVQRKDIIIWDQGKKDLDAADKNLAELLSNEAKTTNAINNIIGSLEI